MQPSPPPQETDAGALSNPRIEFSRATEDLQAERGAAGRSTLRPNEASARGSRHRRLLSDGSTGRDTPSEGAERSTVGGSPLLRQSTTGVFDRHTRASMAHHRPWHSASDTDGEDLDPEVARLERRVHIVMHVKQFFLVYHVCYILLAALVCSIVIFAIEKDNPHLDTRTTFLDAVFISVSGVTCTGLLPVNTKNFAMGSVIIWHVTVFAGSTVFTSIAPSLLRIETLKLLRKLEADSITPVREKHIHRLLRTSRIMVFVTLTYAFVFFAIGMVMLGGSLGFGEGLLRTISAFGNAGFITDPPKKFYTDAINFFAVAIVVPAGSTLFPVFLRPYVWLCSLLYRGYVRLATKVAPHRRVWGDPRDWKFAEQVTVVAAQRKVDDEGNVTFDDDAHQHASGDYTLSRENTDAAAATPQPFSPVSLAPPQEIPSGRESNDGAPGNGDAATVAPSSVPSTAILQPGFTVNAAAESNRALDDGVNQSGAAHDDERAPLLGGAAIRDTHGPFAHYGSDNDTNTPQREPSHAATAAQPPGNDSAELYTGLQNLSMMADDDVTGEVTNRRLARNEVLKGFTFILGSKKPVNHHPWLFVGADTTYLLVAWMLIVLFQFLPFTWQQWNANGVLGDQPNEFMKAVVAFTQSACNRFSGIAFFDFNRLSPAQICTILFALYIPALPIPTERTRRRWKEMFSGGFFRLLLSRFWWLFTAVLLIVFLEEGHSYEHIDGYFDHFHYAPSPNHPIEPQPHHHTTAEFGQVYRHTITRYHPHRHLKSSDVSDNAGPVIPPWQRVNGTWEHGVLTRTLFEVLSAYATAGLSLQLPESTGSLSSSYTAWSQIIIILVMIAGRHRNMDLGLDIGLTDMAATSKRDPERAKRTAHDFDLGSLRVPLEGSSRGHSPTRPTRSPTDTLAPSTNAFWIFGSLNRRQSSPAVRRHRRVASEPFALQPGRHTREYSVLSEHDFDGQIPRADTNTDVGHSTTAESPDFAATLRTPTSPAAGGGGAISEASLDFPSTTPRDRLAVKGETVTPSPAGVPTDARVASSNESGDGVEGADVSDAPLSSGRVESSDRSVELTPQPSARSCRE